MGDDRAEALDQGDAAADARRQRRAPTGLVRRRFEDAAMARALRQQVAPVFERISSRPPCASSSMKDSV